MAQFNSLLVTGDSRFLNPINGNARNGVYYVKGTQTASTGAWTGNIPVPALYDGLTIMYYLPYKGSGNATLNLTLSNGTTTGAVNCYYNTSRLTTHYPAGSNFIMTYWSAGSIKIAGTATTDNRWIANADYDSNTKTLSALTDIKYTSLSNGDVIEYASGVASGKNWRNTKKIVTCTQAEFDAWVANNSFPYTDCKYIVTDVNNINNPTASEIPYDSTNTASVKDVLDDNSDRIDVLEYNSSSGGVDMATYTDSNPYIAPTDGYVMASSEGSSSGQIRVPIRFANGTQGPYMYMNVTGSYQIQSVFVKKGMKIGILANTTSGFVKFYPLDSYT